MRISTSNFFDASIQRLNDVQTKLDRTSRQISSGSKLMNPSDDPVAAARVLDINQSQAVNAQYGKNRDYLRNHLSIVDGTLSSINDVLQSIHEQVVAAGNGSYSSADRASLAQTLQGQRDQLIALANGTDGAGHYLFSGQKTDAAAYTVTGGVVSWQGDSTQPQIAVDSGLSLPLSVSAADLFGSTDSSSFFATLNAAITDLNNASVLPADLQTSLTALGNSYNATLQNVTNAQATVGVHLQQLDYQDQVGKVRDTQYTETLSKLKDLDYNQALSELSKQQLILQAAQKTFAQLSDLSLFNFMR